MQHEPDFNLLAAFAEGRLEAPERTRLVAHLSECEVCRATLALMARGGLTATPARVRLKAPAVWLPIAAAVVLGTTTLVMLSRRPELPASRPASPAAPAPAAARPAAPPAPTPAPAAKPAPRLRRSGDARLVAGKRFRLEAGEWVDTAFDANALLPEMVVTTGFERRALLERVPALRPYAALGDRVTVVHRGTVYRFAVAR